MFQFQQTKADFQFSVSLRLLACPADSSLPTGRYFYIDCDLVMNNALLLLSLHTQKGFSCSLLVCLDTLSLRAAVFHVLIPSANALP